MADSQPFCAHAGFALAGAGSAPVLPCSMRLENLPEAQGPGFLLGSPACPQHVLAPTRGAAAIQRLKAVSAF